MGHKTVNQQHLGSRHAKSPDFNAIENFEGWRKNAVSEAKLEMQLWNGLEPFWARSPVHRFREIGQLHGVTF